MNDILFVLSSDSESHLATSAKIYIICHEEFDSTNLNNGLDRIDKFTEQQWFVTDLIAKLNCSKAGFERNLRRQWFKLNSWTTVKYTPPPRDGTGQISEIRACSLQRIENSKRRKIFEDLIKQINENINSHGAEVRLKSVLYKYGIISKFVGGYEGNVCDIIMNNEKLHEEIIAINSCDNFQSILRLIKNYRFLNSVMSMSDFSQESLAVLSENFQVNVTDSNLWLLKCKKNLLLGGKQYC